MITPETIIYALMGGILPALVWLLFWLREDYRHPEPRRLLLKTFLFGMLAVLLVIPFQKGVQAFSPTLTVGALFAWALLEELFKLGAAYFGGLHSQEDNEPLDPLIYIITAALGFVAVENTMFLIGPLIGENQILESFVITGNLRFVGASLLHVVSSGVIGVYLSISFYKARRSTYIIFGFLAAILIHTAFNTLIVFYGGVGMLLAFIGIWCGVVSLLLAFERIKLVAPEV